MMKKQRLFLVDDHRLVFQWLAFLLSDEHQVVEPVADGRVLIKVGFQ